MKVFDKIRDLFTDEVEEEEVVNEGVKKEVIQVEIPAPKKVKEETFEDDIIIERPKQNLEKTKPLPKIESSPFFDDTDFDDLRRSNPTLEEIESKEKSYKDDLFKEERRAYSPKKEEKKHFSPTPIISPVYGVLDKNYKKDDIVNKAEPAKKKDITLDDVRNKAYGTLEDELESTLFGKTAIIFQEDAKKDSIESIEKEIDETAAAIDLLDDEPKHMKKAEEPSLEDTMINVALEDNSSKIDEDDLFSLIDDMYEKGE